MAKATGAKEASTQKTVTADPSSEPDIDLEAVEEEPPETPENGAVRAAAPASDSAAESQNIDEILKTLKALLASVEKLQKVRQEVGDIKPLLVRMLDGELVAGDELEQLKLGVSGLSNLVKAHSDHQNALAKAQPARDLLDQVLDYRQESPK
ncbi:MAG: hypothetical protein MUF49_32430 [Oculatellaceae cyanobacterium Prado106]|jgi:hypothetical protein|nr:hypothetical protein [Oculatellaceae cyanobacterium Prado106]